MTGKEFEKHIDGINTIYSDVHIASVSRYGVQAVTRGRNEDGTVNATLIKSKPDYEGDGRNLRIIFDAKVCGAASFSLAKYRPETRGPLSRQLTFMLDRSEFGVDCFFLIHWTERKLKTKTVPVQTFRFPVLYNDFWNAFLAAEVKSITRDDCESLGQLVEWRSTGNGYKPRPDYLGVL